MNGSAQPSGHSRQAGLTLVELMVAMTLSTILAVVVFQMLMQAQAMAELMIQRVRFNQEARQLFDLAANGGFADFDGDNTINALYPDERIPGLRGGNTLDDTVASGFHYRGYQWNSATEELVNVLGDTVLNRFGLYGNRTTSLSSANIQSSTHKKLQCTAIGAPNPDCPGASEENMGMVFNGRVDPTPTIRNPVIKENASTDKVANVNFQFVDPDTLQESALYDPDPATEPTKRFRRIPWAQKESYRSTFFLMGDY